MCCMTMILDNQIVNKYLIEVPEFVDLLPPKEELWSLRAELLSQDQRSWDGQTWYRVRDKRIFDGISHINRDFVEGETTIDPYLTVKHEGKWMRPHIDNAPGRNAVVIYPIEPNDYDIVFTDNIEEGMDKIGSDFYTRPYEDDVPYDYNVIYKHTYRCPTILNTKHPHAVLDKRERKMLSFRIYFGNEDWEFEDVVDLYNSGNMFNE